MDKDGYLKVIQQTFQKIIDNEIIFAIQELERREKNGKNNKLNNKNSLITPLTNNTFIFKENLKNITSLMIDQIWKQKLRKEKVK